MGSGLFDGMGRALLFALVLTLCVGRAGRDSLPDAYCALSPSGCVKWKSRLLPPTRTSEADVDNAHPVTKVLVHDQL